MWIYMKRSGYIVTSPQSQNPGKKYITEKNQTIGCENHKTMAEFLCGVGCNIRLNLQHEKY
uniref:Uncharacterized protein n=1 Tax=Octopus bimaculoides TaxID=37653 RepID=A0A0L8ID36_OCTBM